MMDKARRPVYGGGGNRQVRSFVRRQGRMSSPKLERYEALYPKYSIEFVPEKTDVKRAFQSDAPLILEIGFGMGHATADIAAANLQINYLGVEVHTPGVAALIDRLEARGLENVRIVQHDAVEFIRYMAADSIFSGVHIFFPDPWPKKRHFKRRLVQKDFLHLLLPKLKKDGYIYAVTDWEDYACWMYEVFSSCKSLENPYEKWAEPQVWRPETAFERKGLEKRHCIRELYLRKQS